MPPQAVNVLDAVDEGDLIKVHVFPAVRLQRRRIVYRFGGDELVPGELRSSEEEGQELVVVQPPDTVTARGLEIVRHLHSAHEA